MTCRGAPSDGELTDASLIAQLNMLFYLNHWLPNIYLVYTRTLKHLKGRKCCFAEIKIFLTAHGHVVPPHSFFLEHARTE